MSSRKTKSAIAAAFLVAASILTTPVSAITSGYSGGFIMNYPDLRSAQTGVENNVQFLIDQTNAQKEIARRYCEGYLRELNGKKYRSDCWMYLGSGDLKGLVNRDGEVVALGAKDGVLSYKTRSEIEALSKSLIKEQGTNDYFRTRLFNVRLAKASFDYYTAIGATTINLPVYNDYENGNKECRWDVSDNNASVIIDYYMSRGVRDPRTFTVALGIDANYQAEDSTDLIRLWRYGIAMPAPRTNITSYPRLDARMIGIESPTRIFVPNNVSQGPRSLFMYETYDGQRKYAVLSQSEIKTVIKYVAEYDDTDHPTIKPSYDALKAALLPADKTKWPALETEAALSECTSLIEKIGASEGNAFTSADTWDVIHAITERKIAPQNGALLYSLASNPNAPLYATAPTAPFTLSASTASRFKQIASRAQAKMSTLHA